MKTAEDTVQNGQVMNTISNAASFIRQLLVALAGGLFLFPASADDDSPYAGFQTMTVSDDYRTFISNNVKFCVSTEKTVSYPLAKQPMFWLDCSVTNGWSIGDGMTVTKVVSRSQSDRYLTSGKSEIQAGNYAYSLWYSALSDNYIVPPVLISGGPKEGGAYLDFGQSPTSRGNGLKALFFNLAADGTNHLTGVGTIVGVYKSHSGGGNILGGRAFSRRGGYTADTYGTNVFESIVRAKPSGAASATKNVRDGVLWQGFQRSTPVGARWSCDWEVVALNPTALVETDGICGNPQDPDDWRSCGGQCIAELLIFDEILPESDVKKLVAHLESKWLGRNERGFNGNARMSWLEVGGFSSGEGAFDTSPGVRPWPGVDVPVEVGEGETLTVGRLAGGRSSGTSKHKIVKTGLGTLRLGEAENFGGIVDVREGVLEIGEKTVPGFADLPSGLHLRIDPSESGSVTLADGCVSSIENLGIVSRGITAAAQNTATSRPELVTDFPFEGLAMMDFKTTRAEDRRYLELNDNIFIQTLVLVVDSSIYPGTSFMNRMFKSRAKDGQPYQYGNWYEMESGGFFTAGKEYLADGAADISPYLFGQAWVNGLKVNTETEAYETPGINVVALRVPAGPSKFIGGLSADACGGVRIGEILGWNHALTDDQIVEVQAYLMKKWLGRVASGYRLSDSETVPDVQSVKAGPGTVINVPEGQIATIGALDAIGPVEKTGGGTLRICAGGNTGNLVVKEGAVVRSFGADVASACEPAAEPSLHLDPSDARLVRTNMLNGTNYVWTLVDPKGRVSGHEPFHTWTPDCHRFPYMDGSECNGLSTVNFGEMLAGYHKTEGKRIRLTRRMMNVRSVYFVLGSQEGGGNPLGYTSGSLVLGARDWTRFDFLRSMTEDKAALAASPLWSGMAADAVRNGELYVDGIKKEKVSDYVPNGGYELVELHTTAGCEFDALGCGSAGQVFGGMRLGEILVFERPLTEREKVATRNYLLKKWFKKADAELAALPERPVAETLSCTVGKVVVGASVQPVDYSGMTVIVSQGVEVEVRDLPADGTPVRVLSAADMDGVARFKTAVYSGAEIPSDKIVKFAFKDGILTARLVFKPGFVIFAR